MNAKVPYSVEVRRAADRGRANGAMFGMAAYGAALVATGGALFGTSLVFTAVTLFGGVLVAGIAGAYVGKAVAGIWSGVVNSPTVARPDIPHVASEDIGMTHKVQLSNHPDHVAYVHEGRVVETHKGTIKDIHNYQDYIDESRSASAAIDEKSR